MLKDELGDKVRFVNGQDDPDLLKDTLKHIDTKELLVCIATGIYNEGVDIPSLDCVIVGGAHNSSVMSLQIVGRALRKTKDKDTVHIYDIQDKGCKYFTDHSRNRIRIYATEPEFELKYNEEY